MQTIKLTRGQILDLMTLLTERAEDAIDNEEDTMACNYYLDLHSQFLQLHNIIKTRASERQLATLVLTEFTDEDI